MISGVVEEFEVVEEDVVVFRVVQAAIREGFRVLDEVNLVHEFSRRTAVMQKIPFCIRGPFRNAMRMSLEKMTVRGDAVRQERGWKLFMFLTRLLLHRPARGGLISRKKLEERFADFARGEWMSLLEGSRKCTEAAATAHRRPIINAISMGRMTALSKPNGGVRGIVAGDILGRLTARTMAQQLSKVVEAATSPIQYALSTRAGM